MILPLWRFAKPPAQTGWDGAESGRWAALCRGTSVRHGAWDRQYGNGTLEVFESSGGMRILVRGQFLMLVFRIRYILAVLVAAPIIFEMVRMTFKLMAAVARGPIANKCPICPSNRTRPSMPHVADLILPAFIEARRCENCDSRYFAVRSASYVRRAQLAKSAAPRSQSRPLPGLSRSEV